MTAGDYVALLLARIALDEEELCDPPWALPLERVRALCAGQRSFVARHAGWLARRVADGRVVEGHGDLRPEHVWLGEPLSIIDALEFSARLRIVDGADEIAFLALECECAHGAALPRTRRSPYAASRSLTYVKRDWAALPIIVHGGLPWTAPSPRARAS